jgi:UDP-N-acetylmuramyl pentapeptide phosphotransferase/UDP-N-acetylglucosamine-1-phosphate transferase
MTVVLIAVACLVLSGYLTARFCDPSSRFHILDHPNERSLHERPTPRTGGVAIVIAIAAGMAALAAFLPSPREPMILALGALPIAAVAFADDRWGLPVRWRLLTHAMVAIALAFGSLRLGVVYLPGLAVSLPAWLAVGAAAALIVWMTNLYNFMDGMDGFAGGMAVIGFGAFALLGFTQGRADFAALNLIIAASALGFLAFNFPPARIFMGDTGSTTLGFLAASMMLWAGRDGIFPLWIGLMVFSPFVVDATVTLLRRLARRERIWQAHKTHYYQRLVQLGWGHRKTVLWEYALMTACSLSALLAITLAARAQWMISLGWALIYVVSMASIGTLECRARRANVA